MANEKTAFLKSTRIGIAKRLFPVKKTDVLLIDRLEIDLNKAKINLINIPSMQKPQALEDLCPKKPEISKQIISISYSRTINCQNEECSKMLRVLINTDYLGRNLIVKCPICKYDFNYVLYRDQVTNDYTLWLGEQFNPPDIESFTIFFKEPRKEGRSYNQEEEESGEKQVSLFDLYEEESNCIHGLNRESCTTCIEMERTKYERPKTSIDIFDLIFPILQPPLGEKFDNAVALPPGEEIFYFQRKGIKFLAENQVALLGDQMGLGKSIQAIFALKLLFRSGEIKNGLILCPKSVLTDWDRKLWYWAPEIRVVKVSGTKNQRQINWNSLSHIYLATYESLRQDLDSIEEQTEINYFGNGEEYTANISNFAYENQTFNSIPSIILKTNFSFILLDEITKIKNPGAGVTKAVKKINTDIRWGLSGTPLENELEDLITIFAYLKPGLLDYYDAGNPKKIKEAIKPYFLRRRKIDVLPDLPEKIVEEIILDLTPAQQEAYDKAEREGVVELNNKGAEATVHHVFALITKLKQICNYDHKSEESCKLEFLLGKLESMVKQEGENNKALVFSQYPEKTLKLIKPKLKEYNPLIYDGSLSSSRRDKIVDEFKINDDIKVLLMSVKAGGMGITLTEASYVFHYDLWWNPAVASQAEDRAHRINQKKTVFVISLVTANTIEERITKLVEEKRKLFNDVIDDLSDTNIKQMLTEEELFGLFNIKRIHPVRKSSTNGKDIKDIDKISSREFEVLVAELYKKMGYHIKLTSSTKDKGIDIFAKRATDSGAELLAIQCKHYPEGVVGVEHARALYGVVQMDPSITKGILVTSGLFSRDCKDFIQGTRIESIDGNHLAILMQKYNIDY